MRTFQLKAALFAVLALVSFSACQKDGSEGPAGPAGAPGPQGAPGAAGTANVIYSEWLDVQFEPQENNNGDTVVYTANIPAPKLDADILTKGEIKVYLNAGTAAEPAVFPLPFNDFYALTFIENMNLVFEEGNIFIYATQDGSTETTDEGDKVYQYRYVLIPGGTLALKPDNLRLETYKDIQTYLNLKD